MNKDESRTATILHRAVDRLDVRIKALTEDRDRLLRHLENMSRTIRTKDKTDS